MERKKKEENNDKLSKYIIFNKIVFSKGEKKESILHVRCRTNTLNIEEE